MLLDGRTAIITGAASARGIGKATAQLFAEHGARVAIVDLAAADPQAAASDIGPEHAGYACDVRDKAGCEATAGRIIADFGGVDLLVNNAALSRPNRIMEVSPADYDEVMDVNLRGTLYMSQALIPHFRARRSGVIVCLASVAAQRGGGLFGGPHYAASKGGVLALAKAMARELAPDGIRVNAIAPSMVDTDIYQGLLSEARREEVRRSIPMGRLGEARDVAGVCLFLASDLSSYVTGAVIDGLAHPLRPAGSAGIAIAAQLGAALAAPPMAGTDRHRRPLARRVDGGGAAPDRRADLVPSGTNSCSMVSVSDTAKRSWRSGQGRHLLDCFAPFGRSP